jgi:hypothetical protein
MYSAGAPDTIKYIGVKPSGMPMTGQLIFDTKTGEIKIYDGTSWIRADSSSLDLNLPSVDRLTFDTGTVFGQDYLTIQPHGLDWAEVINWCTQSFGTVGDIWNKTHDRWYANNSKFWFRDRKDYDWFVLRWNS